MKHRGLLRFLGGRSIILLVVYIVLLLAVCVFCRESQNAVPRPGVFRSYRAAWHGSHLFPFAQNIILNILLYTPVGFLTCGGLLRDMTSGSSKTSGRDHLKYDDYRENRYIAKALFCAVLAGFVLSLAVECMQMFFGKGTYETDDVLNNTFGALMGASWIIMILNRRWRVRLIWITWVFIVISIVLLSRMVWLCYFR